MNALTPTFAASTVTVRHRNAAAGLRDPNWRPSPGAGNSGQEGCEGRKDYRAAVSVAGKHAGRGGPSYDDGPHGRNPHAVLRKSGQQRSLGSERGLATPSPDGKGEIPLGPSMKIMPVDSYSTLGRSCEPAFKWIRQTRPRPGTGLAAVPGPVPGAGCAAVSGARRWLVRAGRPRGELLVHLTGKLTRGPAGQIPRLVR